MSYNNTAEWREYFKPVIRSVNSGVICQEWGILWTSKSFFYYAALPGCHTFCGPISCGWWRHLFTTWSSTMDSISSFSLWVVATIYGGGWKA